MRTRTNWDTKDQFEVANSYLMYSKTIMKQKDPQEYST